MAGADKAAKPEDDVEGRAGRQRVAVGVMITLCCVAVAILATKHALERPYNQIKSGVKMGDKMMRRDVVKPMMKAYHADTKHGKFNLAEMDVKEAALGRIREREQAQSVDHGSAIDDALAAHDQVALQAKARKTLAARRRPQADLNQELAQRPQQQQLDYHDHPWDLVNPEGMPLPNGGMESAEEMYARAGQRQPPPKAKPADVHRLNADSVMSGGGSEDPRALLDLSQGLKDHEDQPQRVTESAPVWGESSSQEQQMMARKQHAEVQRERAQEEEEEQQQQEIGVQQQQQRVQQARQGRAGAKPSLQGGKTQGFVTGDHLRVSPDEYHREMRYYMPSSDGRLMSPFQWFKSMGEPAPAPAKKAHAPQ